MHSNGVRKNSLPIEKACAGTKWPYWPWSYVQELVDCVQPSLHSDLADEDEHVERAGPVSYTHLTLPTKRIV